MTIDFDRSPLEGRRVLCAVSGGADSMCLLHLLSSAGIDVAAAHFEHGIRGEESLRDARFVENYCAENGIPCRIGHGDVPAYAAEKSVGIEEAARQLRYAFLFSAAKELDCGLIATAHNADDNAETLVFNLTRGSGTSGLRGIPARRDNIVRPLLGVTRQQIEQYLAENAVPHVEDSTNQSDDYTRNLIRHRIIPALKEINPRFTQAAGRTAKLAAQDDDCLCRMARDYIARHYRDASLPLDSLRSLHPAVSSRVLRELLGGGLSMEHIEAILRFIGSSEYKQLSIPGRSLRCEQGRLFLDMTEYAPLPEREIIPGEGLYLPEIGMLLEAQIVLYNGEVNGLFKTSYLKYEIIRPALLCTGRRPGDRLRPSGRGCTKTLKALFAEAGYTRQQRDTVPVIRDGSGILAVCGLALDERAVPQPGEKALKLSFTEIDEKQETKIT